MSVGKQETKYTTNGEGKRVMQVIEVVEEVEVTQIEDVTEIIRSIITSRADLKEDTIEDLVTLIVEGIEDYGLFTEEVEEEVVEEVEEEVKTKEK